MLKRKTPASPLRFHGTAYRHEDLSCVISYDLQVNDSGNGYSMISKIIAQGPKGPLTHTATRVIPITHPEYIQSTLMKEAGGLLRFCYDADTQNKITLAVAEYFKSTEHNLVLILNQLNSL